VLELVTGFLIAGAIGLTGVGAGTITAPVLMLFFHVPPAIAVGTALSFSAVIKLAVLPVYLGRKQVHWNILALLCSGGIPGVLVGVHLIGNLSGRKYDKLLYLVLGGTIILTATYSLYRLTRQRIATGARDRSRWLPPIAAVIGTEVGFSSAGAGALGSLALLNLTKLTPAQVVGTDVVFGLVLSLLGGGFHFFEGHYDAVVLPKLIVGGLAGAYVGASLSATLPARPLRVGLSVWLATLGVQLCWKALA
jgi:uncharacterized membrane protein YfcA